MSVSTNVKNQNMSVWANGAVQIISTITPANNFIYFNYWSDGAVAGTIFLPAMVSTNFMLFMPM